MFEKFAEDVMVRYQQKLAALVKRAEDEQLPDLIPQTQEEQNAEQFSSNMRDMSPEEAAKAFRFERGITRYLLAPDSYDKSPITGFDRGIPQRSAETALENASGIKIPSVPENSLSFNPITRNMAEQLPRNKYNDPIINSLNELPTRLYKTLTDPDLPYPYGPLDWDASDGPGTPEKPNMPTINDVIRRQNHVGEEHPMFQHIINLIEK